MSKVQLLCGPIFAFFALISSESKGWFPLKETFLRTGTDRKVSFVLEPLVPTESSQDKGNCSVRSRPEENYPEWKPALRVPRKDPGFEIVTICAIFRAAHNYFFLTGQCLTNFQFWSDIT